MKQIIKLAKFEEWRVLARHYVELDNLIREHFLDSVQYLELQVKNRLPILISKLEILGCSYTKWFVDNETYFIYHRMTKATGISTDSGLMPPNDPEKKSATVKVSVKKARRLPKTDDSNNE